DFGEGSVDLNDWKTAVGADFQWEDWSVDNAIFSALEMTSPINCDTLLTVENNILKNVVIYPNPATDHISLQNTGSDFDYRILNISGDCIFKGTMNSNDQINVRDIPAGLYVIEIRSDNYLDYQSFLKH
ncbi:MAG TPA: T9SS type A sorting domain-containing protein, partial [Chitinophagales bacterium]|nr:T9SS type A sorting domain-containing protein [Chitinophagales bacterium]